MAGERRANGCFRNRRRELVAKHKRQRNGIITCVDCDIRSANTRTVHFEQCFALCESLSRLLAQIDLAWRP